MQNLGLLSELQCPVCSGRIVSNPASLTCNGCATTFDVVDGRPIMMSGLPSDHDRPAALLPRGSRLALLLRRFVPSPTLTNHSALAAAVMWAGSGRILDAGSGERRISSNTVNLDISLHSETDVVADAHRIPFRDNTFRLVVCQGVLEHVLDADRVIRELFRVAGQGRVYVEVPMLQPFHADPADFRRFTLPGLIAALAPARIVDAGATAGCFSAVSFMIRQFPDALVGDAPRPMRLLLKTPFVVVAALTRYGDMVVRPRYGERVAASIFAIAEMS